MDAWRVSGCSIHIWVHNDLGWGLIKKVEGSLETHFLFLFFCSKRMYHQYLSFFQIYTQVSELHVEIQLCYFAC